MDKASVENALKLDDTSFKGRQIKVLPKRQNIPMRAGRGRGRGGFAVRGRGGRGAFRGRRGGFRGGRGRGRGYQPSYY
jgi:polyadenylate-binding protein 2